MLSGDLSTGTSSVRLILFLATSEPHAYSLGSRHSQLRYHIGSILNMPRWARADEAFPDRIVS